MLDFYLNGNVFMLVYASLAALSFWYLISYLISPLRQFPGPTVAGEIIPIH